MYSCTTLHSFYHIMRLHHSISKLTTLERETKGGEGERDDAGQHHKSSLQTWQVWTFFILAVFTLLFLVAFIQALRRRRNEKNSKGLAHRSPLTPPPLTKDMEELTERRSELVFFVDKEEWFELDELLEGVAELRTQSFCSSLYVVRLRNGPVYAVKRLRKLRVSFEEFGVTMRKVGSLRHPNLLPLVCYNNTLEEKLLIYGFQPNGSLLNLFESYAEGKRAFPWKLRVSIAAGIARGLHFIHSHQQTIPHGIIKLSNIMLDEHDAPMISEYGYAQFLSASNPAMNGYEAPEKRLSEKSDGYSFGVILLELLTGKSVEKSGSDLPRRVRSVVREEWTGEVFDDEVSEAEMYAFPLLNVALKCVEQSPHERPSIAEVLERIEEVVNAQQDV